MSLFRVDGIPHFAFVSAAGDVETALIGLVPSGVFRAQLDALLQLGGGGGSPAPPTSSLPYLGFDAFARPGNGAGSAPPATQLISGRGVSVFDGGRNVRLAINDAEKIAAEQKGGNEDKTPGFAL